MESSFTYLIAYDLVEKKYPEDYKPLWAALDRIKAVRLQESLWQLFSVEKFPTCEELAKYVLQFTDIVNDRVLVAKIHSVDDLYSINDLFKLKL